MLTRFPTFNRSTSRKSPPLLPNGCDWCSLDELSDWTPALLSAPLWKLFGKAEGGEGESHMTFARLVSGIRHFEMGEDKMADQSSFLQVALNSGHQSGLNTDCRFSTYAALWILVTVLCVHFRRSRACKHPRSKQCKDVI